MKTSAITALAIIGCVSANNYASDPYNGAYYDYSDQSIFDLSNQAEVHRQVRSPDTHTTNLASDHVSVSSTGVGGFAQASQVAPVQDNSLYYNNYASDPYNGAYYDYSDQPLFDPSIQADVDRQDPLTAGLTLSAVIPVVTIFVAALSGALAAPAISAAARSLWEFAAEIPNIEINLPGATEEE